MVRASDFVDPEYDRKLAEYKALKAKIRQQQTQEVPEQRRKFE